MRRILAPMFTCTETRPHRFLPGRSAREANDALSKSRKCSAPKTHWTSALVMAGTTIAAAAGPDQIVSLLSGATLAGSAFDDGLPATGALITTWSQVSGPGTVTFGNPNARQTSAVFTAVGTYVLRLTANDGALSRADDV